MRFLLSILLLPAFAFGGVGDPQIKTDHPWYPGELAISTFDRLFETQAAAYERVTGKRPESDEDKALAAWFWRNTHYWHGTGGGRDLWGEGLNQGKDKRLREYWNGMFGYGFGLCGTTHSQWTVEIDTLLGRGRGRGVGVAGHNAFEVFLRGGSYGEDGRWALLDHDLSTVIFDETGSRLISIGEMQANVDRWIDRRFKPDRQRGWLVCGLHPNDGNSYKKYAVSEPLAGYAGPPPMVHLRRGERMRRYFEPGLEDGKTFVFWGRNGNAGDIPGPERSRTWVNQPEAMNGSKTGTAHVTGQARYANVEYVFRPVDGEGIVDVGENFTVFDFQTPYVIAATPVDLRAEWGIYLPGCRNGLVVRADADFSVSISVNAGRAWSEAGNLTGDLDLTDLVKGRSQYWIRLGASPQQLLESNLEIRTVCQANVAVLPRLKDGGTKVSYAASNRSILSIGPELELAKSHIFKGAFGEKEVTLRARSNNPVTRIYAAAHIASGNPPDSEIRYQIEYSVNDGEIWLPLVKDWRIPRLGDDPGDFWSQSFCYGEAEVDNPADRQLLVRFRNDGGKRYLRAEIHLAQQLPTADPLKITYDWSDDAGEHQASSVFESAGEWKLETGADVRTRWVEMSLP
ncbi:MAG: hypothetical protein ACI8UO_004001 [Verrucomicrobiales bacterium]|jgi:hypothetical protein